ncbi:hypothetical protein ACFO4N_05740 [Camelliibacillus cellulosilyticus]|uniref:Type VII secretion effector (TIGR04197 family) n=1 Tax=Camelliibacillus cellulosilyticus TaxID=2174486 RepID=A0ABV9GM28_9BACL
MEKEVSINLGIFQETINDLRSSALELDSGFSKGYSLDQTNIPPFVKDLERMIKAVELFERYRDQILISDIKTLENVGESLRQQDDALSGGSSS